MDDPLASTRIRPLARSLDPLTGESLGGYLLRLAYRLHLTPIKLARRIGCAGTQLSRRLLLDLDVAGFAQAARLTLDEAAALCPPPLRVSMGQGCVPLTVSFRCDSAGPGCGGWWTASPWPCR